MARSYIVDDPVKQRFLLDREALVSQSVLADEMRGSSPSAGSMSATLPS